MHRPATTAAEHRLVADEPAAPLVKWPGGKRRELPGLQATWPTTVGRYLEPFVGGGSALLATSPDVPAEVNDASEDLVALWRAVQSRDAATFDALARLAGWWNRLGGLDEVVDDLVRSHGADDPAADAARRLAAHRGALVATDPPPGPGEHFLDEVARGVPRKLARMAQVERERGRGMPPQDVRDNVEGALRAAAYTAVRSHHNGLRRGGEHGPWRTAGFAVLRELAYAAMFRFNRSGDFNVPYGGISYNRRDLTGRVASWLEDPALAARLATTTVHRADFADFLDAVGPEADDFVFLDPPYLSDFRDYDGNGFGPRDHQRLAAVLRELPGHFQLVIKATPEVRHWYGHDDWTVREVDKTYAWTIKSRNDRRTVHLVIQNSVSSRTSV